jgi:DNA-dependent protein kinase catalytic subunit
MSPIGTAGLFRATMIDTMNALRENSDLLLSTMDVFIKEPLMEWMVISFKRFNLIHKESYSRNMHLKQVNKFLKAVVCF